MDNLVEYSTMEKTLQSKISHLETIINDGESMKKEMMEKLDQEIKIRTKAEEITKQLESKVIKQNIEAESMKAKLSRSTLVSHDFREEDIIEALALLRQQKQLGEQFPNDPTITKVNQKLQELETAYVETCGELDKVRAMLVSQHQICKQYELEIEKLRNHLDLKEKEISAKTNKHMQLLDEKSLRIQKLESALRNIAYGNKSTTILQTSPASKSPEIFLEPGQIMLYLKITKVTLSDEAVAIMKSAKPDWFLTVEFYDFDLQFTPVVCRTELALDYTFYYVITASDLFVRYLQTGFVSMEFHQVMGEKYRTLAVGRIELKDLSMQKTEISGLIHLDGIVGVP
uniref:RPGR-interacting protein 1 first C2 domain-containing protein n=1 Tax=Romanomermis culicivorax TaxID=13658 RepID=A0A915LDY2_ROMCU